jgi:hypothetical protein
LPDSPELCSFFLPRPVFVVPVALIVVFFARQKRPDINAPFGLFFFRRYCIVDDRDEPVAFARTSRIT